MNRRPEFCTPDMPRLDWQMWFAALSDVRNNSWLVQFLQQLLRGSRPVLALLETDPFPDHPPEYIRAVEYKYRFTTIDEKRVTGAWWHREEAGAYCPLLTLDNFAPMH